MIEALTAALALLLGPLLLVIVHLAGQGDEPSKGPIT